MEPTFVTFRGAADKTGIRTEELYGRTWTVVPVVGMVEGVVHAMNAAEPEFVPFEAYAHYPVQWNGRPVFINHPLDDNGNPVAGNTPHTLEAKSVGLIFNTKIKNKKLTMEAWLDNDRQTTVTELKDMLERIADGDDIEISIGSWVVTEPAEGEHSGRRYASQWTEVTSEHLALLQEGDTGACSRKAGCGVRAAKEKTMAEPRKGIMGAVMSAVRALVAPDELNDNDIRRKLSDALRAAGISGWVEAVYADKGEFVYCSSVTGYYDSAMQYKRQGYTVSDTGVVMLNEGTEVVEPIMTYEPVVLAAAQDAPVEEPAPRAAATGCRCHEHSEQPIISEEKNMKREDLIAKIGTMSDEQLDKVVLEPETPAVVETVVETPAVAAAPTFETLLAAAPVELRESIESNMRAASSRKTATIKTLKDSGRCDLSDAKLQAMSQVELDALVKLAGVQPATDFSAAGSARVPDQGDGEAIAAPRSLSEALGSKAGK